MNYSVVFLILIIFQESQCYINHKSFGCHKEYKDDKVLKFDGTNTSDKCVHMCIEAYYKYAFLRPSNECFCGNVIGPEFSSTPCNISCVNCISQSELVDVFKAAHRNEFPGPCKNLRVSNVTDTSARLTWELPRSFDPIIFYQIQGQILSTTATYKLNPISLRYFEATSADLSSLHPSTEYNLTIYAANKEGNGEKASYKFTTQIGEPDHTPSSPTIIRQNNTNIEIYIKSVTNNNGPVSKYIVIVKNMNSVQIFEPTNLKNYEDANRDGLSYYIAAELDPLEITQPFVVGDEKTRENYYNAKLIRGNHYQIIIGVKSVGKFLTKYAFSNNSDLTFTPFLTHDSQGPTLLELVFYVAITIMVILIIMVIVAFVILKRKITARNRQHLSDNQELTLQGPMIDMENNGYIHDDDLPTNHKETLNNQVWNIPRHLLNKEHSIHLGQGRFGSVQSGTVEQDHNSYSAAIYSIIDERLNCEEKRCMLKDLDTLIRIGKHDNVIELIGICEDLETVNVVLEHATTNLKDMLLNSRNATQGKISTIREATLLDFAIQICKGMAHLESKHIVHKQLCARNIVFVSGVPKVSGLGLAQYNNNNLLPIYTRWTAKEIFRGQSHVSKSDVWSFACILWEICTLGATPYGNIPNSDIPDKILRGMRLKQMQYVDENLYQVMLNCWQLDLDERPTFIDLIDALQNLIEDSYTPFLNLNFYPNFHYEQYYSELELIPKNM